MSPRLAVAAGLVALLAFPCTALAERYRVDLILFQDRGSLADETALPTQAPDLARSIDPGETARLRSAGIEILPDTAFGLDTEWQRLRNSRRHEPLVRLAWLQKDPPSDRGVSLRLRTGTPYNVLDLSGMAGVYPIDGSVALLLGRFLHVDADLVYTRPGADGELGSFRLRERRRVRRGELHHLDSPRIGLLVKVQKAEQ